MKEENIVRKIINNEITRYGAVAVAIWKIYTSIILPLNNLQIQSNQIQIDLRASNKKYDDLARIEASHETRISILESNNNKK